jgi:hypothetical protein
MHLDRKGEAGFMEAILAAMVVTVALTGFMGLLALNSASEDVPSVDVDIDTFDGLGIVDGKIAWTGDEGPSVPEGICGIRLTVSAVGGIMDGEFVISDGECEGLRECKVGTAIIGSDDGRAVLCNYEVETWT